MISATVLFIVLSGFAGLKKISLQHLSFFDPDLKIESKSGKTLSFNATQEERLKSLDGVLFYSRIIEERVYLEYNKKSELAFIKGVDTAYGNVVILDICLKYSLETVMELYHLRHSSWASMYCYIIPLELCI